MSTKKITIYDKLFSVISAVTHVDKTGYNDAQKYNYVQEADAIHLIRPLLIEHRLLLTWTVTGSHIEHFVTEQVQTKTKYSHFSQVEVQYEIRDIDAPETPLIFKSVGHGIDNGDKAVYKALTGAHKYFLLKVFNIPTSDDPEKPSEFDHAPHQYAQLQALQEHHHQQKYNTQARPEAMGSPGEYVVPFGKKYKGKSLAQMNVNDIESFKNYLIDSAKKDGKPLSDQAMEYVINAEAYLLEEQNSFMAQDRQL